MAPAVRAQPAAGEAAFHALQAGYFDSWPRPPGATFAVWREAEGRLYRQLVKECNSSKPLG